MNGNLDDGAKRLDEVEAFFRRFVIFPDEYCSIAVTLFAAHTFAVEKFYVTPRLILDSAEPECGKTRVLELLALLCREPKMTFNTTVAALYRRLQDKMLTVLLDEADAIWSPKAGPQAEDLRAFVNAGYKRGATVDRCVGDGSKIKVVEFPVFAPMAIAGIAGNMPATVTSRGVIIHMRRRKAGEQVDPYEEQDVLPESRPLRDRLSEWVESVAPELDSARPAMPAGVTDRRAEVWRALLAIADAAGGEWPERAREACEHFTLGSVGTPASLGIRLLTDLKAIFGDKDRMTTVDILEALTGMDEAPWGEMRSTRKPLDSRGLSGLLKKYEVGPATFKVDGTGKTAKGYATYPTADQCGLADAWERWLPPADSRELGNFGNFGNGAGQSPDDQSKVTDISVTDGHPVTSLTSEVTEVTEVTDKTRTDCPECLKPLDPALVAAGFTTHGEEQWR